MKSDKVNNQSLFGTEEEGLTSLPADPMRTGTAIGRFLSIGSQLAPSVPGPSGYFNSWGRVYTDSGHIELASCEVDDPYQLPIVVEKQHRLAAKAVAQLAANGMHLVLANNNHSGLLSEGCPVWGAHENYLVEKHPSSFTNLILPFLVTRIYAGSGGIRFPSGEFVAGVRSTCMEVATGGGTTHVRAIHSTAREEHHVGSTKRMFRCHEILGDGHRSHFNLALQFGATALALKAVIYDATLTEELKRIRLYTPVDDNWVILLRRLNRLAAPGVPLTIDPLVVQVQRIYLEAACRVANLMSDPPPWIQRSLMDWENTIDAMERLDRRWLAARLDTFAKYELYSKVLQAAGATWESLPAKKELFNSLALLDQNYHEFCNPNSIFCRLEASGLLAHQVGIVTEPGSEPEPHIPETSSRARARAFFIREHANEPGLVMDWSAVHDVPNDRMRKLSHPFARSYGSWQSRNPLIKPLSGARRLISDVLQMDDVNAEIDTALDVW